MHELSVATEIHRACRARLPNPSGRLERVKAAVGELSAVEPELLRYAWEAATARGPDAGAALEIEWREAIQACGACGARPKRVSGAWHAACPECGAWLRVEGGRELDVIEFAYATPAEAGR
jgi:Zn finger protein HypA/HybF involved in hydrogenase expression